LSFSKVSPLLVVNSAQPSPSVAVAPSGSFISTNPVTLRYAQADYYRLPNRFQIKVIRGNQIVQEFLLDYNLMTGFDPANPDLQNTTQPYIDPLSFSPAALYQVDLVLPNSWLVANDFVCVMLEDQYQQTALVSSSSSSCTMYFSTNGNNNNAAKMQNPSGLLLVLGCLLILMTQ
jgi:hypothetical protein